MHDHIAKQGEIAGAMTAVVEAAAQQNRVSGEREREEFVGCACFTTITVTLLLSFPFRSAPSSARAAHASRARRDAGGICDTSSLGASAILVTVGRQVQAPRRVTSTSRIPAP